MEQEYKRLPGRRLLSAWGTDSLWMGNDHLLSIKKKGYTEEYRRFYFPDIQSIYLVKTHDSTIWNVVVGAILVALIFIFVVAWREWEWETEALIAWGILTGVFLLILLVNFFKGPTCTCLLRTAVQTETMPSLHRVRSAQKAIQIIRSYVESVQGAVSPEKLQSIPIMETGSESKIESLKSTEGSLTHYESGNYHVVLYALLLANGGLMFLDLFYRSVALYLLFTSCLALILVFIILAAVRQRSSNLSSGIKKTVWLSLALVMTIAIGAYVNVLVLTFQSPNLFSQVGMLKAMMEASPLESIFSLVFHIYCIAGSVLLGSIGLILILHHRKSHT